MIECEHLPEWHCDPHGECRMCECGCAEPVTLRDLVRAARRAGIVLKRDRRGRYPATSWIADTSPPLSDPNRVDKPAIFVRVTRSDAPWRTQPWMVHIALWPADEEIKLNADVTPQRIATALLLCGWDIRGGHV